MFNALQLAGNRFHNDGIDGTVFRVAAFEGFGGRRAGEALVVSDDGQRDGSLLHDAGSAAYDDLVRSRRSGTVTVPIPDDEAVAAGLACGGQATVVGQRVSELPEQLWNIVAQRRPCVLCSPLDRAEAPFVVDDASPGAIRRESRSDVVTAAQSMLERPRSVTQVLDGWLLEYLAPRPLLLVLGASELGDAIVALGTMLGWDVGIVDERVTGAVDAAVADIDRFGPLDAVVVLSHALVASCRVLWAAVTHAGYVGALGSRHTQAARAERLRTHHGASDEQLRRIHGPVGLDIGARTPEETALAVLAEALAYVRGRSATALRDGAGPING